MFDTAATAAWEAAVRAPLWKGPPVWIHGDLLAGNLLARDGRLNAVIDFGSCGVGDLACDAMAAWTYLTAETRDAFRAALPVEDATWARGRG
jgi:aminoglycoside phosphotransferase (APT) family kinase protein